MQFRQITQLDAAMEALAACVDADRLLATLLVRIRHLFRMETAFVWLATDAQGSGPYLAEGAPPLVASRLQHLKMSPHVERNVAGRLHRLGYRVVLAAAVRDPARKVALVAACSSRVGHSNRIAATAFKVLLRYAVCALGRLPFSLTPQDEEAQRQTPRLSLADIQNERSRLLSVLISGITHDLNNVAATISGRVELLLLRLHDQTTLQHLGVTHHAIGEAVSMIRQIHGLASGYRERSVVMVDINQLVRDSLQIVQATWFQTFRQTRFPIEWTTDLQPAPAVPGQPTDLRIVLLSLFRQAMDTCRPGSGLTVRTWCEGEDQAQTVFISISDQSGQPDTVAPNERFELLLRPLHEPDNERPEEFVQAIMRDLGGRVVVSRSSSGSTTTTLSFSARRSTPVEG